MYVHRDWHSRENTAAIHSRRDFLKKLPFDDVRGCGLRRVGVKYQLEQEIERGLSGCNHPSHRTVAVCGHVADVPLVPESLNGPSGRTSCGIPPRALVLVETHRARRCFATTHSGVRGLRWLCCNCGGAGDVDGDMTHQPASVQVTPDAVLSRLNAKVGSRNPVRRSEQSRHRERCAGDARRAEPPCRRARFGARIATTSPRCARSLAPIIVSVGHRRSGQRRGSGSTGGFGTADGVHRLRHAAARPGSGCNGHDARTSRLSPARQYRMSVDDQHRPIIEAAQPAIVDALTRPPLQPRIPVVLGIDDSG